MTARGFDSYWLAGKEIWASKKTVPVQIDLELLCACHQMHIREAVRCSYDGERTAAADHRDRADEIAAMIRERSPFNKSVRQQSAHLRAGRLFMHGEG